MSDNRRSLDELCINTIRFLAVDAIEQAKSGHPGAPMGGAAVAYTLWDRFLKHSPANPDWPDRDRFILSAGHASMLLYALLHLTGYDMSLDDLKQFRQWGSKTPGHPERTGALGIEVTTGPLGQGFANGVGMAIAERWLACRFNRPGHEIVSHYTYAYVSDGDLQEGVASEAASLAGTLGLGRLIYLYDDNGISIEGSTAPTFRESVAGRFAAYGWQVIGPVDGLDLGAIEVAIREAQADASRPSLIICKTTIGYGSPVEGTGRAHGEPLGADATRAAKERLGWPLEPSFLVPDEVAEHMRQAVVRGRELHESWRQRLEVYRLEHPELAAQFEQQMAGELPDGWDDGLDGIFAGAAKPIATRNASGKVLNALCGRLPALIGGAADLAPSTKTLLDGEGDVGPGDFCGRNMHYGIREHAMGAISNGMAVHGGLLPYTGTFLVFSDYMRPPMRLAAMMHARVVFVFTHDSIGLGEDGPTHQPIEQLAGLRAIPNMSVIRPADATETVEAWRAAVARRNGPTTLIFSRQNLPVLDREKCAPAEGLRRGGYVLWEAQPGEPQVILIGTGSEVHIALDAATILAAEGVRVRVVSLPCWDLFDEQPAAYRDSVLPPSVSARVSVEAAATFGWERYVGPTGTIIGLRGYGASAPYETIYERLGFTPEAVAAAAREVMRRK